MHYQTFLLPHAQKDLDSFKGKMFERMCEVIKNLSRNPRPVGSKKLTNEEAYRIRIGDYRILYRIDEEEKKVFLYRIRHRKDAYR